MMSNRYVLRIGKDINSFEALLIAWYCFFSYFKLFEFSRYSAVVLLGIIVIIPTITILRKPSFPQNTLLLIWFLFTCIYSLQSFWRDDFLGGSAWMLQRIMLFLLIVFLMRNAMLYQKIMKYFVFFSMIHVISTILEFLLPNLIHAITSWILVGRVRTGVLELFTYGYHCGIAEQASFNACFIMLGTAILLSDILMCSKVNIIKCLLLFLSFIAMILTGKRGMLLAEVVAIVFCFLWIMYCKKQLKGKYIFLILLGIIGIYFIMMYTDVAENIIRRTQYQGTDFLSGRDILWKQAMDGIKEHPIWGNGTASYASMVLLGSTHNSFLQIWYENGLIGVVLIILVFSLGIGTCMIGVKKINENKKKEFLLASLCYQIFFAVSCLTDSLFQQNILIVSYLAFSVISYALVLKERNQLQ